MSLITTEPVLVTGATGFIAAHIVSQLLNKGYTVRGTVRDLKNTESYKHLTDLQGSNKLQLVEANCLKPDGWKDAVSGCEYVMHTASPYKIVVKDPQKDLVDPALLGVQHVLEECRKAASVKKLVLTSSVAAISDEFDDEILYDESVWNTKSTLNRNPYYYSKTIAEREAHSFIEKNSCNFELVVINPFAVIGPSLRGDVNPSVATIILPHMHTGDL
eukprot:GHVR01049228.1.p1 GENE.GHVR01049228.1~~GHVR01049228.1.p1  ORF type:complete len:217 (+),score=43.90 GHVR01049228.1:63-713(+)